MHCDLFKPNGLSISRAVDTLSSSLQLEFRRTPTNTKQYVWTQRPVYCKRKDCLCLEQLSNSHSQYISHFVHGTILSNSNSNSNEVANNNNNNNKILANTLLLFLS